MKYYISFAYQCMCIYLLAAAAKNMHTTTFQQSMECWWFLASEKLTARPMYPYHCSLIKTTFCQSTLSKTPCFSTTTDGCRIGFVGKNRLFDTYLGSADDFWPVEKLSGSPIYSYHCSLLKRPFANQLCKKPAVLHQHGFVASLGSKSQLWIEDT